MGLHKKSYFPSTLKPATLFLISFIDGENFIIFLFIMSPSLYKDECF